MKKKLVSTLVLLAAMCTMAVTPFGASAKTYSTWSTRGVKYLAWTKDSITWSTNNANTRINSYDANQKRSGLFVVNQGVVKEKSRSTSSSYSLLCKHTFLVGAQVSGVTLGWNDDINDRWTIRSSGSSSIRWDV